MAQSKHLFSHCHVGKSVLTGFVLNSILSIILHPGPALLCWGSCIIVFGSEPASQHHVLGYLNHIFKSTTEHPEPASQHRGICNTTSCVGVPASYFQGLQQSIRNQHLNTRGICITTSCVGVPASYFQGPQQTIQNQHLNTKESASEYLDLHQAIQT